MSEIGSPSTITVGRGKKFRFDKHEQDKLFLRCAASSPPANGWVLLGNADPTHQQWTHSTTPKIANASPAVTVGQTVTFAGNVFLRADAAENEKPSKGSILGAARTGSTAVITDVNYLPNKKGNAQVWVKVKMKSNQ